jgi:cytochrome c-type biogenesis protein CcmH/NrfG
LRDRQAEARTRLEGLTGEDPKRPGPWASLGYLAWRDGDSGKAAEQFGKAFDLGNRNPRLLLNFAQLAGRDKPESATAALTALLELEPTSVDARLLLASIQMSQSKFADALETARPIKAVRTEDQRDNLIYLRAFASMGLGDMVKARALAEQLKKATTSPTMQSQADDILRFAKPK